MMHETAACHIVWRTTEFVHCLEKLQSRPYSILLLSVHVPREFKLWEEAEGVCEGKIWFDRWLGWVGLGWVRVGLSILLSAMQRNKDTIIGIQKGCPPSPCFDYRVPHLLRKSIDRGSECSDVIVVVAFANLANQLGFFHHTSQYLNCQVRPTPRTKLRGITMRHISDWNERAKK